ncbi:MAG: hypothetical protein S4CHLAM102_08380 [Chlamydiia bacterium]|nr:hypothetical protein [Chlamydiia bacterium]
MSMCVSRKRACYHPPEKTITPSRLGDTLDLVQWEILVQLDEVNLSHMVRVSRQMRTVICKLFKDNPPFLFSRAQTFLNEALPKGAVFEFSKMAGVGQFHGFHTHRIYAHMCSIEVLNALESHPIGPVIDQKSDRWPRMLVEGVALAFLSDQVVLYCTTNDLVERGELVGQLFSYATQPDQLKAIFARQAANKDENGVVRLVEIEKAMLHIALEKRCLKSFMGCLSCFSLASIREVRVDLTYIWSTKELAAKISTLPPEMGRYLLDQIALGLCRQRDFKQIMELLAPQHNTKVVKWASAGYNSGMRQFLLELFVWFERDCKSEEWIVATLEAVPWTIRVSATKAQFILCMKYEKYELAFEVLRSIGLSRQIIHPVTQLGVLLTSISQVKAREVINKLRQFAMSDKKRKEEIRRQAREGIKQIESALSTHHS